MSLGTSKGTLEKVVCPWPGCGFELDFTDVPMVEAGTICSCDKCKRHIEVLGKKQLTVISLRAIAARPGFTRR